MAHKITSQPASEPVSLEEAKLHLKVDYTTDDNLITDLIASARAYAEEYTNTKFFTQTVEEVFDCFPISDSTALELLFSPIQSVSSVTYIDMSGTNTAWDSANYSTDTFTKPARILPAYGQTWPSTRDTLNAVKVTYLTGYSAVSDIPKPIKQAILLLIGEHYEKRQNDPQSPFTYKSSAAQHLLDRYRMHVV